MDTRESLVKVGDLLRDKVNGQLALVTKDPFWWGPFAPGTKVNCIEVLWQGCKRSQVFHLSAIRNDSVEIISENR